MVSRNEYLKGVNAGNFPVKDQKAWNMRVDSRRNDYLTPYVIRPFVNKLMQMGVLVSVEKYTVAWPDLNTVTDKEKAEVSRVWAEAFSKFVAGDVRNAVPLPEFLSIFSKMDVKDVKQIVEASVEELKKEQEMSGTEEPPMPPQPPEQGNEDEIEDDNNAE